MSTTGPMDDLAAGSLPQQLFGYEVIDFIGEGAGSLIYAVSDPITKQIYALKHVVRKNEKDIRFVEQLENEFEVSKHFSHPALRKSLDVKVVRTMLRKVTEAALVMELFDGVPLDMQDLRQIDQIADCYIQVAQALEAMHGLGYVHCDLKPNNILMNPAGAVKVIDFGQACPPGTKKSRIQGTPDFIAPEQVKCEAISVRTDVFNFGATLYWSLTGGRKLPTLYTLKRTENSFLVDDAIQSPAALNPQVPESLSNLVMECVKSNPAKRPADMQEVARRMEIIRHAMRRQENSASVA